MKTFVVVYAEQRVITFEDDAATESDAKVHVSALQQEAYFNQGTLILGHNINDIKVEEVESAEEGRKLVTHRNPVISFEGTGS